MEIKNVYPPLKRKLNRRRKLRTACGWCFLAAAAACVIVNICVGGKAWSAVALWALWMILSLIHILFTSYSIIVCPVGH